MSAPRLANWPYPLWVAHRGAGTLAPENTLAAFRLGAAFGYRAFECDVKLSADNVPFLLHDATLDRTTQRQGAAADLRWATLSRLDAGSWHSPRYAGEPPPSFAAIARFCVRNQFALNIEIKPSPGRARETGQRVAAQAATLWRHHTPLPLLSSFKPAALEAAREAAPHLPRGLLFEALKEGWFERAHDLQCVAVAAAYAAFDEAIVQRLHDAGLAAIAYTVNDPSVAKWLLDLGVDTLITDAVDRFPPAADRV